MAPAMAATMSMINLKESSDVLLAAASIVISLLTAVSLLLIVLMCCGGGSKKEKANAEYVRFDFRSPYFCEPCAMRGWEEMYPNDPNPMAELDWQENKARLVAPRAHDYNMRLHYFEHPDAPPAVVRAPTITTVKRMKDECQSVMQQHQSMRQQNTSISTPPTTTHQPPPAAAAAEQLTPTPPSTPAVTEPVDFKSARNPAYRTLYDAKSNVFDQRKGGSGARTTENKSLGAREDEMRAAQANPAYRTIWDVKSGIFDKPGAGGGTCRLPAFVHKTMAREVGGHAGKMERGAPQKSMIGPGVDEGRMKEAAANPAYRTLYGAKSEIFDRPKRAPSSQAEPLSKSTMTKIVAPKATAAASQAAAVSKSQSSDGRSE